MRVLTAAVEGLRALFQRRRVEQELDEELRAYHNASVDRKIAAGMSREDAIRAARVEMGSTEAVKDDVRDAGWESHVESVWQDLRYAFRGLRRSRGFAAVAILTLALGIGANSAIFSVVNGLLLRALPVTAPEQLAILSTKSAVEQGFPSGWNYPIWDQIRQRKDAFSDAIAWTVFPQRFDLAQGGETEPVDGLFVSGNFFERLGVPPMIGRTFAPPEDTLDSPDSQVAVISYGFWQRRFGGAGDTVGRSITVNRVPVTIVGVTPPAFLGPEVGRAFDMALPFGSAPVVLKEDAWGKPEGRSYLAVMLRLKPDQSLAATTDLLRSMQEEIIQAGMPSNGIWGPVQDGLLKDPFTLTPASTGTSELRRQYARPLMTVLVIALLVLIIACANIANLFLARTTARRHESSVRLALGASRWRLAQQMLIESLLLSGLGAGAGMVFANWGSRALVAQLSTWFDRVVLDVSLDWRVVAFTAAIAVATAVVFGTAPAIHASRAVAGAVAKESFSARSRSHGGGVRLRGGLVIGQVALSLVLLVAAGLFVRTFERLAVVPLGFESDQVLVVDVDISRTQVDPGNRLNFYQRLANAVGALPGVAYAAASLNTPGNRSPTLVADFSAPDGLDLPQQERRVIVNYVTPGWFEAYGMAVRAGRVINERDAAGASRVVVANEAFVRKFFPGRQAVNSDVFNDPILTGDRRVRRTVVGVVGNAVDQSLRYGAMPTLYEPLAQCDCQPGIFPAAINLSIRAASGSPGLLARSVAGALMGTDRNLAFSFRPLAYQIDAARQQERLVAWLSGFFGVLALLLAMIGLYGVTAYGVAQRRAEIGIRMALGAQRHDILRLALRQTILWTISGVAVGLAAAAAVTRYLETMLFGITPLDPATFIGAPVLLAVVAGLAALIPAKRAATVDPMVVLRCE
ncbi:MAG TPA: ABC transporter permease [Vicinamibacterales bacterium]|nr:ABC transporter permease [Vicinamibacterales bacterium]